MAGNRIFPLDVPVMEGDSWGAGARQLQDALSAELEDEGFLEAERHQIEQIRELEFEELQVEEVEENDSSDDGRVATGAVITDEVTYNTCLASLHTYLGEVEDTHHRLAFMDGGSVLHLPLFYLEGVVLFPEATLPLRVIQSNFICAIERALTQVDAPYIIGVVRAGRDPETRQIRFSTVGTTAEIRQYRRLEDGSLNVVTRGQQRFRVRRRWSDMDGVPSGEIQIIHEEMPLRTPSDAFGKPVALGRLINFSISHSQHSKASLHVHVDGDNDSERNSVCSFEDELSEPKNRIHRPAAIATCSYGSMEEPTSSEEEMLVCESIERVRRHGLSDSDSIESSVSDHEKELQALNLRSGGSLASIKNSHKGKGWGKILKNSNFCLFHRVARSWWPSWVYQMFDSYFLAQTAADMWKHVVGIPNVDDLARNPHLLSFCIASKIPVSEPTRQELLEIDGISYRLRREIDLLKCFDLVRCKHCKTVIARRSDMLVMSSDGPLSAYVNPQGFVHEVMTLWRVRSGLALVGQAVAEYSWFPGYAWTVTNCGSCETQMGWLFTATKRKLKPPSFWAIRSSQIADDMQ